MLSRVDSCVCVYAAAPLLWLLSSCATFSAPAPQKDEYQSVDEQADADIDTDQPHLSRYKWPCHQKDDRQDDGEDTVECPESPPFGGFAQACECEAAETVQQEVDRHQQVDGFHTADRVKKDHHP